jgi:hypothetical protein
MRRPRSLATAALIAAAVVGTASAGHHGAHVVVAPGQPAPRVGPSYLYPDPAITPGVPNPDVTQATIQQTICVSHWTATIRPAPSYTDHLKAQQLQAARYTDKSPAHYEEDHLISLGDLGAVSFNSLKGAAATGARPRSSSPARP